MAMVLCFSMTAVTAFAAEDNDAPVSSSATPSEPVRSIGDTLVAGSKDLVNTCTISLNLSSGNWSADFLVKIVGNPGAHYEVRMTTPGGSTSTSYIYSNTGYNNMVTLVYASAGTYTFEFTRLSGSASTATATAKICD